MFQKLKEFAYNLLLVYKFVGGKAKIYHKGYSKSKFNIFCELLSWYIKECDFNHMYYAFGLNLAGSSQKEIIGRKEFMRLKNKAEKRLKALAGCELFDYDVVTKDKFIANSIFTANNIPCIENSALYCNSTLIFRDGRQTGINGFKQFTEGFILKNTVIESGDGVFVCSLIDDKIEANGKIYTFDLFKSMLGSQVWVVQQRLESSIEIRKINHTALNTTRIVTIMNNNKPEYLCGFQAFATAGATTDSWNKGSVYVGIDITRECLKADGYCNLSDKTNGVITRHPDSGIEFGEYKIPGLFDAVELCLKAHKIMYFNFAIGWDVAITDNGPVIVEANEKPGMNVAQCIDGGLKNIIYKYSNCN